MTQVTKIVSKAYIYQFIAGLQWLVDITHNVDSDIPPPRFNTLFN